MDALGGTASQGGCGKTHCSNQAKGQGVFFHGGYLSGGVLRF
jgi:hypothetical protein